MRRLLFAVLAILCFGISGCASSKNDGRTYKGVKQTWGMQAANIQVPKDLEDTSSDFHP